MLFSVPLTETTQIFLLSRILIVATRPSLITVAGDCP